MRSGAKLNLRAVCKTELKILSKTPEGGIGFRVLGLGFEQSMLVSELVSSFLKPSGGEASHLTGFGALLSA